MFRRKSDRFYLQCSKVLWEALVGRRPGDERCAVCRRLNGVVLGVKCDDGWGLGRRYGLHPIRISLLGDGVFWILLNSVTAHRVREGGLFH